MNATMIACGPSTIESMVDYSDRLEAAMQRAGVKTRQVAEALGVSYQAVARLLDGKSKAFTAENNSKAAAFLKVSPDWLASGKGEMDSVSPSVHANVSPIAGRGGVPLISWVQAGAWSEIEDPFEPGEAEQWLPCPVKHGPRSYCLRVEGESMRNPDGRPSYEPGDVLFVDPDQGLKPGDRGIFRLDDEMKATFKQYMEEDGKKYLKALNPDWTPRYIIIDGNATICGKVIGTWKPE